MAGSKENKYYASQAEEDYRGLSTLLPEPKSQYWISAQPCSSRINV